MAEERLPEAEIQMDGDIWYVICPHCGKRESTFTLVDPKNRRRRCNLADGGCGKEFIATPPQKKE